MSYPTKHEPPCLPMPSKDASEVLTTAYFEHTEFFSPIPGRQKFLDMLDDPTEHSPQDNYRTMVVFVVAGCLLNRKDPSFPISRSEVYYATALRLLADNPSLSQGSSIEHLCNYTLAIQYSMFQQSLTAAWYLLGHATRMAIELGLHLAGDTTDAQSRLTSGSGYFGPSTPSREFSAMCSIDPSASQTKQSLCRFRTSMSKPHTGPPRSMSSNSANSSRRFIQNNSTIASGTTAHQITVAGSLVCVNGCIEPRA